MIYIIDSTQMKVYDSYTINEIGVPALVLMERAALSVLKSINDYADNRDIFNRKVLIMAGYGNNGGDGIALARLLCDEGYKVSVWLIGDKNRATDSFVAEMNILFHYDEIEILSGACEIHDEYSICVDALFGIGLSRDITGEYENAIMLFNSLSGHKYAVDIPSGINADNGKIMNIAVKADVTVTFGFAKIGQYLYPGCEYVGELKIADIGINEKAFAEGNPSIFCLEGDLKEYYPKRDKAGNKGTFGKILVIAGSYNMAGAALLCSKATLKSGAGMVKLITDPQNRNIIQESFPECMLGNYGNIENDLNWADVVVIGPGMGLGSDKENLLSLVINKFEGPLVMDADALNILSYRNDIFDDIKTRNSATILTPHIGELSKLSGKSVFEIKEDYLNCCVEFANMTGCILVAKDARTLICSPQNQICINITGNDGMATAGCGDVLAGIIGSFVGQQRNDDIFDAVCKAVYVHGALGDSAIKKHGKSGLVAGDLFE